MAKKVTDEWQRRWKMVEEGRGRDGRRRWRRRVNVWHCLELQQATTVTFVLVVILSFLSWICWGHISRAWLLLDQRSFHHGIMESGDNYPLISPSFPGWCPRQHQGLHSSSVLCERSAEEDLRVQCPGSSETASALPWRMSS